MSGVSGEETFLYYCRNASGRALYIGVTSDVARRVSQHRDKHWWVGVSHVETTRCATRADALALETVEIKALQPPFNRSQAVDPVEAPPNWHANRQPRTKPTVDRKTLISLAEAAEHLGVNPKTIRRRISDGTLTAYRSGPRLLRVDLAELEVAMLRQIPTVASR